MKLEGTGFEFCQNCEEFRDATKEVSSGKGFFPKLGRCNECGGIQKRKHHEE